MAVISGLSGNEIYCLNQKGYRPGDIVIGNSVYSLGLVRSIGSGLKAVLGGELEQVTELIAEGREQAYQRLAQEIRARGGVGVTGVTSELIYHNANVEFLSVGSALHSNQNALANSSESLEFSSSADGQELFAQIDAGYKPICFSFGNVAYSMGITRGILGSLKVLARGEIKEFSNIFNQTRHLALSRIVKHAEENKANAVVGIKTTILPFSGVKEMIMIGTASHNPQLPDNQVITSDLTNQEMWSLAKLGYAPQKLLLGTSVYSLGLIGNITAMFKSFVRGEINELTKMIYDARENAIGIIKNEANNINADDVVGIKTYVYDLGSGLIEFLAIGTAVKKVPNLQTQSEQLPPQAVMPQKRTFFDVANLSYGVGLNEGS